MLNVAIIGFGYMGQMFSELVKAQSGWKLVGVHDVNESLKSTVDNFFKDRAALISHPQVEAVVICTPPRHHLSVLKECLAYKKHVILEKPLGSSMIEAEQVYEEINKCKDHTIVAVNITHCFYKNIREAKEIVDWCDIQNITAISDRVIFPVNEKDRDAALFKKANVGHGVMLTNGCHLLARISSLFASYNPVFKIVGGILGNTGGLGDIADSDAHMRLIMVLNNQHQIPVSIFTSWPPAKMVDENITESMEISFRRGTLHIQAWGEVEFYEGPTTLSKQVPYNGTTISEAQKEGVKTLLQIFEQAVVKGPSGIHESVKYTYQAERTIGEFYSKFTPTTQEQ